MSPHTVHKFGGSSLESATAILNVVSIISSISPPPLIVLSAIGKTTSQFIRAINDATKNLAENADFLATVKSNHAAIIAELRKSVTCMHANSENCSLDNLSTELNPIFEKAGNLLRGLALIGEAPPHVVDEIMASGERLSVRIVAATINCATRSNARSLDADKIGLITKSSQSSGSVVCEQVDNDVDPTCYPFIRTSINEIISSGTVPVVTGFIARNPDGRVSTLGRGGSDLSAVVFGAALDAAEVTIWTDTDGVKTADPRIIPLARQIERLTFEEAAELAWFGAKVLHPRSIQPAAERNIPVKVRNSRQPENPGTTICDHANKTGEAPSPVRAMRVERLVLALTRKSPVELVHITALKMLGQYGFLAEVFAVFRQLKISVDVIATSEVSVSLTLDRDTPVERVKLLKNNLAATASLECLGSRAIIALIGDKKRTTEVVRRAMEALGDMKVDLLSLGASGLNTSIVMEEEASTAALERLHRAFFE